MKQRVGIYNRCSTEEEAQVNALGIQAEESREVAHRNDWLITGQYIESESGTSTRKRTEYQRLLEDMDSDKFDIVMIKSIDRLTRSTKDWYLFLDKLTRSQKRLYIYIDRKFYTAEDSLITGIKAILAEDFSRELSKKIKNAHHRRQTKKTGLNITNSMFGWDKVSRDNYVINEAEAVRYREAFQMVMEGKSFYAIAEHMYEQGVRSKKGKRIADVQWRKMLYSPRAHGTVVLHKEEYDFDAKKKIMLPPKEWIYIDNALPPIVTKEYHEEILDILSKRSVGKMEPRQRTAGYLSGKIICGDCGSIYYRKGKSFHCAGNRKQTQCRCGNVSELDILRIVKEVGADTFDRRIRVGMDVTGEALAVIREVLGERPDEAVSTILEREYDKIVTQKDLLFQKLLEQTISNEDFEKYYTELEDRRKKISGQIDREKKEARAETSTKDRLPIIENVLADKKMWETALARVFLEAVDRIVVYPEDKLMICFGEAEWSRENITVRTDYVHEDMREKRRLEIGERILCLFRERPDRMLKEIYTEFEMGESYINKVVKQLKKEGKLQYIRNGNTHTGKWIVTP